jgi:transcriptional regulator with XRE-family HTH domain
MPITNEMQVRAVLAMLGERIAQTRLQRNFSQAQLARDAGIHRNTVVNVEAGKPVSTENFLRILRALDLLAGVDQLVPATEPSPIELLRMEGKQRKRAGTQRGESHAPPRPWRWGDEADTEEVDE